MKLRRLALWLVLTLGGCLGTALAQSFTPGSAQLPQSDNFDGDTIGSIAPGWFAVSGNWQVGTISPVSNRSFGDTLQMDGDAVLYSNMAAQSDMQVYTEQVLQSDGVSEGILLRTDSAGQNGYLVTVSFNTGIEQIIFWKIVSGTYTVLSSPELTLSSTTGDIYAIRAQVQGSTISAKVWLKSGSEPGAWSATQVDHTVTAAGYAGFRQAGNNARTVDNFTVSPPTGANPQTLRLSQSGLVDAAGNPLSSGTVNICPVTSAGIPLAFHAGGGGTGMARCAVAQVTDGAWTTNVVDTYVSSPQNLCLNISSIDPTSNQELIGWHCVQPSITAGSPAVANGWCTLNGDCSLDRYSPSIPALAEANLNGGSSSMFNGGPITNPLVLPADPTTNLEAATKQYVDSHSSGAFNGGSITNPLVLPADPTANLQAATKQYVDNHAGSAFNGGSITNPLVLPADPTTNLEAATKQYVDNHAGGIANLNGKSGTSITLTPADLGAAPATDAGNPLAQTANNLISANTFYFSDHTKGFCAAPFYCGGAGLPTPQEYGSDTILAMLANPAIFTAGDFLNLVNKFIAVKNNGSGNLPAGDFPESIKGDGTVDQWCSGDDLYCHHATGDGRIAVPIALYLYWQRTGDLTAYTANVAAIKTAMSNAPRNGSTHLITVIAGQEHIPGIGYMEQMRPIGDVADANVWDAWDAKAMQLMAAAAGDSTNATYFGNLFAQDVTGITTTLTDSSTKLLWFATGSQMHQIDIVDSTLAAYPLLGPSVGPLLGGTQITAIGNWLDTNYTSIVNSQGYVKLVDGCDVTGVIPVGGGTPYGTERTTTQYQCGYWATFAGYFAYTLGQADPAKASTFLQTYLSGSAPTTEFYDSGGDAAQALLMTSGQSIRQASELIPAPQSITTGLCVTTADGHCTNYVPPSASAPGANGLTVPFIVNEAVTAALSGYNTVGEGIFPNAANGSILAQGIQVAASTNNAAFWDFHYVSPGSASNRGCLDIYGINCIASWWPGDYFGADAYVGTGHAPTLAFTTGSGALGTTAATNTAGSILIYGAGAFDFTLSFLNQSGTALSAPDYWNCSFNVVAKNSDIAKMVGSSATTAEAWGTTTAAGEYVTYQCSAF